VTYGKRSVQANKLTHAWVQRSLTSVGLTQARPNDQCHSVWQNMGANRDAD